MSLDNTPAIYCGTYAKYNNGSIFGKWFNLDEFADKDEFIEACLELHGDEDDPELMFQDWENIPGDLCSESSVSEKVWEYMDACEEYDQGAVDAYLNIFWEWDKDAFEERYCGSGYREFVDYAEELFDECYAHECPDFLRGYIDVERFARDLEMDYTFMDGYVFRST